MNRKVVTILRPVLVLLSCLAVASLVMQGIRASDWYRARLVREMFSSDAEARLRAGAGLAQLNAQRQLLEVLKSDHDGAREMARRALEHIWFNEAGDAAYQRTQEAFRAAERDDLKAALVLLNGLVKEHPKFAEGWNQRASVYWQLGDYEKSLTDCRRVLELNPNHYGAWQGLGLCQLNQGDLSGACQSLRIALRLLPHDDQTRQSLRRCEDLLRQYPAGGSGAKAMQIL
jgi:tetratricopeptide (TPR) repeat protein